MKTWMIVGLGNPGSEYEMTRHNVGFMVAEELASRAGAGFSAARGMKAATCQVQLDATGEPVGSPVPGGLGKAIIVKPTTYMNESGQAVGKLASFHGVPTDQIIVIHDELDIDFGQLRLKIGGGDNGHNGLKSIRAHLNSGDFYRVRFGIGRPPGRQATSDYVLGRFPAAMHTDLQVEIGRAADAVASLIADGLAITQNRFNH